MKKTIVLVMISFMLGGKSYAHFGLRGQIGGTVVCATANGSTTLYLGTAEGGVFESKTNALTTGWTARPVGLHSGKIAAIAHTGSYLFTATADSGIYRFTGYVGSDRYWERVNKGITNYNLTALVAIDSITLIAGAKDGKLFKTTDKGANWTLVNDLVLNQSAIKGLVKAGNRLFAIVQNNGVYYSDDNGSSWAGLNDVNTANVNNTNALAYNSSTDELMVSNENGVYVLANAATTSSAAYVLQITGLSLNTTINSISSTSTNWYLATNKGVYTSLTNSINWVAANTGLTTANVNVVIPFSTFLVAGTTKVGVFKTAASSINWTLYNTSFNNVKAYATVGRGDSYLVNATENGVYLSKDLGATFIPANKGLTDSLHVNDFVYLGSKLFAVSANGGVYVSIDTAKNWSAFNTGLTNLSVNKVFASADYVYIFDSNGIIYQSNGLSAWVNISGNLPLNLEDVSMAFYLNKIILGIHGEGVYIRKESTGDWKAINDGLGTDHIKAVAALGGYYYAGTHMDGVWVTKADQIAWTKATDLTINHTLTMGLDASEVQAMATYGGYVFASYHGGLVATRDHGKTWERGGNQFNLPSYTDVNKITFLSTRVYVTTENNSVYSNGLSELGLNVAISPIQLPTCHGDANAVLKLAATGGTAYVKSGTPYYKILWNTGDTTETITNVKSGSYFVTVTDNATPTKNSYTDTFVVKQPDTLVNTFKLTTINSQTATLEAQVIGGVSPYAYAWSTNATTSSITANDSVSYTLTITDDNGCVVEDSVVALINHAGLSSIQNDLFVLAPNPSTGHFAIQVKQAGVYSVVIYNELGSVIQEQKFTPFTNTLSVELAQKGIYFVKVQGESGMKVEKVIIR